MKIVRLIMLLVLVLGVNACISDKELHTASVREHFVEVNTYIPSIHFDIRYYSGNNFVGERIAGYEAPKCYLTRETADALRTIQGELLQKNLSLLIYDCYRPQKAVDHFVSWARDLKDTRMKSAYYPSVEKENLFRDGYIAEKSGHSRGSTVDLTIIDLTGSRKELDMGTSFDFFDPLSYTINDRIAQAQQENRILLKTVMEKHGFKSLKEEWWHYTLENEPYADTYFDFPVK